jgi:hypothetical protein
VEVKSSFRTVLGLEKSHRSGRPENADSLPAGLFCEKCRLAVFPEGDEVNVAEITSWLEEHEHHGGIWEVVETPGGAVAAIARIGRVH